jgi:gliding motility-associated-like protein
MQRTPEWINADYATVSSNNEIELSFTIDPLTEIKTFGIERKSETESDFNRIAVKEFSGEKILYSDKEADPLIKHQYRLSAINNCGIPVVTSNISGNIVLKLSSFNDNLLLEWNSYPGWRGSTDYFRLFINTGNGFTIKTEMQPADTVYEINYSEIMYDISQGSVCFYVSAHEKTNIYGITGESSSNAVCSDIIERITVPTAFTPDNDLVNDYFKPFLSFTPDSYRLIISDRNNNIMFESNDHLAVWDGTRGGSPLPQGVYIWFLRATSPSGKAFSKSGTVTIIKNR